MCMPGSIYAMSINILTLQNDFIIMKRSTQLNIINNSYKQQAKLIDYTRSRQHITSSTFQVQSPKRIKMNQSISFTSPLEVTSSAMEIASPNGTILNAHFIGSKSFSNLNNNRQAPRKLTILKQKSIGCQNLPENYVEEVWNKLSYSINAIYDQIPVSYSRNQLYRDVENLCINQFGYKLYCKVKEELNKVIHRSFVKYFSNSQFFIHHNHSFLKQLCICWTNNYEQLILTRSIFGYLDSTIQNMGTESLWDVGLKIFKSNLENVFETQSLLFMTINDLLEQIRKERKGESIDRIAIRQILRMLIDLQMYTNSFETSFITQTEELYNYESYIRITDQSFTLRQYLEYIRRVMDEEKERLDYCLDSSTRKLLLPCIREQLIEKHKDDILNKGFNELLDDKSINELAMLYEFFLPSDSCLAKLRIAFEEYIKLTGYQFVKDPEKDKTMVKGLLEFKQSLDEIGRQAFANNPDFIVSINRGFSNFINKRENKPNELLARYVDCMLRSGHKGGLTDDELEISMDKIMVLFRFINGKDVFEGFYKAFLSKRLLLGKSASVDAEKAMLIKLKQECGSEFTSKLEGMFKDIEISKDLSQKFRMSNISKLKIDLSINILSTANWPTYVSAKVQIPEYLKREREIFEKYYLSKHNGRKLEWQPSLDNCKVKANFKTQSKELHVSLYQLLVLQLFNVYDTLTMEDIKSHTNIPENELKMTLIELNNPKTRILNKKSDCRTVSCDNEFSFNEEFTHKLHSIKINHVQMKISEEDNDKTREKIMVDRNLRLDAAIVRIMKMRKKQKHTILFSEVCDQVKFAVTIKEFKTRIEILIDNDYLCRDKQDANIYHYLA